MTITCAFAKTFGEAWRVGSGHVRRGEGDCALLPGYRQHPWRGQTPWVMSMTAVVSATVFLRNLGQ
ncbi:hypothetical protein GIX45_18340 [Erwinia sp. CPCC 100877]|nr:hypothetical protein [Erwinia sp. CPCC 100877]